MATASTRANNNDDETNAAIYRGVNQDQLMKIFGADHRTVRRRITEAKEGGVKPVGIVRGADIYSIKDVAPYFVKPIMDPETYIRQMDPSELPKLLTKEFWAGQRNKQVVQEAAGDLWSTSKVISEVGEILKMFKMAVLLVADAVDRESELNDKQRRIIKNLTHGALNDVRKRIQTRFVVKAGPIPEVVDEQQEDEDDEEI